MKKLLGIIVATIFFTSCNLNFMDAVRGDKNIVKQEYEVSDFTSINLNTVADIVYKQVESDSTYLCIEIDSNLVEYLEVDVNDGRLNIRTREKEAIDPSRFIIYTNSKTINEINLSGVGNLTVPDKLSAQNLKIFVTGVGDLEFKDLQSDTLTVRVTGAGDIALKGNTSYADFMVTGVGRVEADGFEAKNAKCVVSGVGSIDVHVTDSLRSSVSGVGSIDYKGDPHVVSNVSGVGSAKNKNN